MKNILLTILLASTIWSCGSRKTNKSKAETETSAKSDTNLNLAIENKSEVQNDIKQNVKTEVANDIHEKETHAKPVDPSKPMKKKVTKEGNFTMTEWENAEVTEKSRSDQSKSKEESNLFDNSKSISDSKLDIDLKAVKSKESKTKESEKITEAERGFSFWWFLLLLIPVAAYAYMKKIFPFRQT